MFGKRRSRRDLEWELAEAKAKIKSLDGKNEELFIRANEAEKQNTHLITENCNLKAELSRANAIVDAIGTNKTPGCTEGLWCGACEHSHQGRVTDLLGRTVGVKAVCTVGKCDKFEPKEANPK